MNRVAIIGFGHIGSAIATVLSLKSKIIYGIDNNKEHISKLNNFDCPFESRKISRFDKPSEISLLFLKIYSKSSRLIFSNFDKFRLVFLPRIRSS